MREFSEKDIEKYMNFVSENVLELDEIRGRCFQCGELLSDLQLPEGPEKKVVCLRNREDFVEEFEGLVEFGELN